MTLFASGITFLNWGFVVWPIVIMAIGFAACIGGPHPRPETQEERNRRYEADRRWYGR